MPRFDVCRFAKEDNIYLLLLTFFIFVVGVAPHVAFSWQVGSVSFFKGAFDEDTYLTLLDSGLTPSSRFLSSALMKSLLDVFGGSPDLAMVAADVIFPVATAVAAWFLAAGIFEPHRVCRRLQLLSRMEHDQQDDEQVFS